MTDLKDKTVEEMREMYLSPLGDKHEWEIFDEMARRLEEAQNENMQFKELLSAWTKAFPGLSPIEAQQKLDRYTRRSESGESLGDHYDALDALEEAQKQIVVLQQQCNFERSRFDRSLNVLMGIYNLLYPPRFSNSDGITFEFHSPHVHEQMQALSDRIREIPDSVSELKAESDAAHDAETAAKALEEAKEIVLRRGALIHGAIDPELTAAAIEAKAAEYRTKAGRKNGTV